MQFALLYYKKIEKNIRQKNNVTEKCLCYLVFFHKTDFSLDIDYSCDI